MFNPQSGELRVQFTVQLLGNDGEEDIYFYVTMSSSSPGTVIGLPKTVTFVIAAGRTFTHCMLDNFACFLSSADVFFNFYCFRNILSTRANTTLDYFENSVHYVHVFINIMPFN